MPPVERGILVTGSNGFIGSALVKALKRDGHRVVGLDRESQPQHTGEFVACDLASEASVAEAGSRLRTLFPAGIDSIVHLAAYYDFSGEPSSLYEAVTVRGTERLVAALRPLRPAQFVFSSTMLVHAPCAVGSHLTEDSLLEPKWDYPQSKLDTEELLHRERGDMPLVVLRIAGVYTDDCDSVPLANQIQRIYERRLTAKVFPGDVKTGQSYVHLDDLIDAVRSVIERRDRLPPETTILIGEEDPSSYDELQHELASLIHGEDDWETTQIPKAVAKAGAWVQDVIPGVEEPFIKPWMIDLADDHFALDTARARHLLGWNPRRRLRATLPAMVASLKANPVAWYRRHKLEGEPKAEEPVAAPRAKC